MSNSPWLVTATELMGTTEVPGSKSNPKIMDWAKKLGGWITSFYKDDSIPWCGLFVAHCFNIHGIKGPKNPLSALAWADWGIPTKPSLGSLLVFKRTGGGHVGFYVGETDTAFLVRGGNQSDKVCDTWISKDRHVATRWPEGFAVVNNPVYLTKSGKLSSNEA
jgi:uncharacterized protein (TIGR02594 family)